MRSCIMPEFDYSTVEAVLPRTGDFAYAIGLNAILSCCLVVDGPGWLGERCLVKKNLKHIRWF